LDRFGHLAIESGQRADLFDIRCPDISDTFKMLQ
jgi:hypothetical protein